MPQVLQLQVLVRVGGPQLKYDYFGGRGLKRLRTTDLKHDFYIVVSCTENNLSL